MWHVTKHSVPKALVQWCRNHLQKHSKLIISHQNWSYFAQCTKVNVFLKQMSLCSVKLTVYFSLWLWRGLAHIFYHWSWKSVTLWAVFKLKEMLPYILCYFPSHEINMMWICFFTFFNTFSHGKSDFNSIQQSLWKDGRSSFTRDQGNQYHGWRRCLQHMTSMLSLFCWFVMTLNITAEFYEIGIVF